MATKKMAKGGMDGKMDSKKSAMADKMVADVRARQAAKTAMPRPAMPTRPMARPTGGMGGSAPARPMGGGMGSMAGRGGTPTRPMSTARPMGGMGMKKGGKAKK
jgi:hypothetical protein